MCSSTLSSRGTGSSVAHVARWEKSGEDSAGALPQWLVTLTKHYPNYLELKERADSWPASPKARPGYRRCGTRSAHSSVRGCAKPCSPACQPVRAHSCVVYRIPVQRGCSSERSSSTSMCMRRISYACTGGARRGGGSSPAATGTRSPGVNVRFTPSLLMVTVLQGRRVPRCSLVHSRGSGCGMVDAWRSAAGEEQKARCSS